MTARMHELPHDLLTNLLASYRKSDDVAGESGLLKQLAKLWDERVVEAGAAEPAGTDGRRLVANSRQSAPDDSAQHGRARKTLRGAFVRLPTGAPREIPNRFESRLAPMHLTRWSGFDERILSLYARGLTVREIQVHLQEIYGAEISPGLISSVTEAVMDEIKAWQARPLDPVYPIVYLDCVHMKVREGAVRSKAVYLAIGLTVAGEKEVLGLWLAQTEDAEFWSQIASDIRRRGTQDIFIACVDGSNGFARAIETVFPRTRVQLCIVHMLRDSLDYASWKRRPKVAADLKRIYTSADVEEAERCLCEFEATWDKELLPICQSWRRHWERLIPFFDYAPEIRRVLYMTNTLESVNRTLRRMSKQFGAFSSDEALMKLLYLMLRSISKRWTMPIREWKTALNRFAIHFGDRLPPL